jgi:hypothetical protein
MKGWIGVDLDCTLAEYHGWKGDDEPIGKPIPLMIDRVKFWLDKGKTVKIFTARVDGDDGKQVKLIKKWCKKHLGQELEVTNVKTRYMYELWDDRAIGVQRNTGQLKKNRTVDNYTTWKNIEDEK